MLAALFTLFVILWVYYMQFYKIATEYTIFADDLKTGLKTGDMILFKAYNNFNSIFHGSYFGHVGIVYIDKSGIPLIFEANGLESVPLREHHSKSGIFLTPLIDRIKKYKGRCFIKPLDKPISSEIIEEFEDFMEYGLKNFKYDYNLVSGCIKRALGITTCGKGTDCGQLVFLSLLKLKLLDMIELETPRLHHLRYVCNVTNLQNSYKYLPLVEVIDHPFAY
jgi:hypothetical protein